jgi:hypothetical protein
MLPGLLLLTRTAGLLLLLDHAAGVLLLHVPVLCLAMLRGAHQAAAVCAYDGVVGRLGVVHERG